MFRNVEKKSEKLRTNVIQITTKGPRGRCRSPESGQLLATI